MDIENYLNDGGTYDDLPTETKNMLENEEVECLMSPDCKCEECQAEYAGLGSWLIDK